MSEPDQWKYGSFSRTVSNSFTVSATRVEQNWIWAVHFFAHKAFVVVFAAWKACLVGGAQNNESSFSSNARGKIKVPINLIICNIDE